MSEVLDRSEMDVMQDALPVLSAKIARVIIIGMAGVGMAKMVGFNQSVVFYGLISWIPSHGKIPKPRSGHYLQKEKAT